MKPIEILFRFKLAIRCFSWSHPQQLDTFLGLPRAVSAPHEPPPCWLSFGSLGASPPFLAPETSRAVSGRKEGKKNAQVHRLSRSFYGNSYEISYENFYGWVSSSQLDDANMNGRPFNCSNHWPVSKYLCFFSLVASSSSVL